MNVVVSYIKDSSFDDSSLDLQHHFSIFTQCVLL